MAIVLLITTEDNKITELPIFGKVILGRSSSSNFKITDIKMSATHCSFHINSSGQLVCTDLGSSNGTYINNNLFQQSIVLVNDLVRIGNTIIKIDEKKLSSSERRSVGISPAQKNDMTLPDMSKEACPPRKTILLDKTHKKK